MKTPVSLEYVVAVMVLAAVSATLSYVSPNPAYNLAALLLGVYALHLVSLRVTLREYVTGGAWSRHLRGKHLEEIRSQREQLEMDRRELENRKAELQQRIDAAEQQWDLLRQMIRDRVDGGAELPASIGTVPRTAWTSTSSSPSPGEGTGHPPEDSPRIHGRW